MNSNAAKSNVLLLLTALIWGFAFVAQRVGMEHVGPFTFNGVRFTLGAISLTPLLWLNRRRRMTDRNILPAVNNRYLLWGGFLTGFVLFVASSLQQIGIIYTTAGKAGFITGLYIVIVPILGVFLKQRTTRAAWVGAILATIGLYFLSVTGNLNMQLGDLLVFISAFFWAAHVQIIGRLVVKIDALKLAFMQFAGCAILSLASAPFVETVSLAGIRMAAIPIIYAGLFSVGIGYTLQAIGQRHAPPANAAIILSLESVFAVVGGWLLLGEILSVRGIFGCSLMLAGMLLSQVKKWEAVKFGSGQ